MNRKEAALSPDFALPRWITERSADRPTYAPDLAEVAEALGFVLLGWQRLVADVALEHDGGRLAFRDVVVTLPRQAGKSTLLLALVIWRMIASPGSRIAFAAQHRMAARAKLLDDWWPAISASPFGEMFKPVRATGGEQPRCSNGSLLRVMSADE